MTERLQPVGRLSGDGQEQARGCRGQRALAALGQKPIDRYIAGGVEAFDDGRGNTVGAARPVERRQCRAVDRPQDQAR